MCLFQALETSSEGPSFIDHVHPRPWHCCSLSILSLITEPHHWFIWKKNLVVCVNFHSPHKPPNNTTCRSQHNKKRYTPTYSWSHLLSHHNSFQFKIFSYLGPLSLELLELSGLYFKLDDCWEYTLTRI